MSEMLTDAQTISEGILEKLGIGTGCLGTREGGRLFKNHIFFSTF